MAKILAGKLSTINGIKITQPVQSNGIFVIIPHTVAAKVNESYFFYPWNEKKSEYRLMTSWDTTVEDIEDFVTLIGREMS